jgi:2-methylisocitrate lyase-like PEP mutase family enzyme
MTGFGATAVLTGCPDLGLLTQTEMTTHAASMVRAVDIPVIADADTGYGGPANIDRTVREYLQAGVAAIHLEDQALPKRCGHMAGVRLVPAADMARRLECAIAARGDDDLLIIGRTDALAAADLDEAIARAQAYKEAGADILFVDACKAVDDARALGESLEGPLMMSVVEGNETAALTPDELQAMGFSLAVYPISTLLAATWTIGQTLSQIRTSGTTGALAGQMATYHDFTEVVRLDRFQDLDERFGTE